MQKSRVIAGKSKWSRVGFSLSVLCAIHCASMPFLVALLPLMGSQLLHNPTLEIILMGTTILIAGIIMVKDYRHIHKNLLPLFLLSLGIGAKCLGLFVLQHSYEPVIITSGAAFILVSYIANWRLRVVNTVTCKC